MGCSSSKFEEEEAVQLCKDRKNFIRQAINQRIRFSSNHVAYVQSLRQVSAALCDYIQGDECQDLLLDALLTSPSILVKKYNPNISGISCNSFLSGKSNHYLISDSNPYISIEKSPQSQETVRIEYSYPTEHLDVDGLFALRTKARNLSFFSSSDSNPIYYPLLSPQKLENEFFGDPFLLLETEKYPYQNSSDDGENDDSVEDQTKDKDLIPIVEGKESGKTKERENTDFDSIKEVDAVDVNVETNGQQYVKEYSKNFKGFEKIGMRDAIELSQDNGEYVEGTPTFNVNFHRTTTSIYDAMRETHSQFMRICDHAEEVSEMLEASRFGYCPASNELTVIRMLNPANLIRSASSRSSSTRLLEISTSSREEKSEISSDISEEEKLVTSNHHSTLDRLYAWEKKLYEEIKYEEHIRTAYEKKYKDLKNQEAAGEDPFLMDKTRRAIQNLRTKLRVSIRSIQAISMRIERLRDEELHPQLTEMIQGLARFWRKLAGAHRTQKHAMDEASSLLPSTTTLSTSPPPSPSQSAAKSNPSKSASILSSSLHNWSTSLQTYITSQRSYAKALAGWVNRCTPPTSHEPPSSSLPPIVNLCIEWSSRLLDCASEMDAIGGLEVVAEEVVKTDAGPSIVCDGMADAFGRLAEFASGVADGYEELSGKWEEHEVQE